MYISYLSRSLMTWVFPSFCLSALPCKWGLTSYSQTATVAPRMLFSLSLLLMCLSFSMGRDFLGDSARLYIGGKDSWLLATGRESESTKSLVFPSSSVRVRSYGDEWPRGQWCGSCTHWYLIRQQLLQAPGNSFWLQAERAQPELYSEVF